ncbi:hypothetical protein IW261DRAFT_1425466 [Armillaria novae-zelandiae]|uniref:Uncharacterized protein n=1 Tax=Armillaria novae-zelandiae TaxID=153914 RepID=A0AA39NT98_9AGAR|nr:hypothetical protein IW261DRAFT_1425466 [Armillaria novae-zelandiae]
MRYDVEIGILEEQWKDEIQGRRRPPSWNYAQVRLATFSLKYATLVIRCITENLAPSRFMRGATDSHFKCVTFAAIFLFKLLRPEFSYFVKSADKHESVNLTAILTNKLSSSDIAVDDRHSPKLYARFLAALLSNYRHKISHEKAVSDLQTAPIKNTDILTCIVDDGMSRQWPQPQILTYQPEVTHATGVWPQFRDAMEFPYVTNDSENVGNGERGSQRGMSEDEVFALMQGLIHPEWFRGMLMPGYVFSSFIA